MEEDTEKKSQHERESEKERDATMHLSLSFPATTLSSIWPPTPAVWFVDKWVGEVSVSAAQRERRSSLLLGIIAQRRGGRTLASQEDWREWVREAMLGMMGNQTSSAAVAKESAWQMKATRGRQGEREEREESEHPDSADQRGTP